MASGGAAACSRSSRSSPAPWRAATAAGEAASEAARSRRARPGAEEVRAGGARPRPPGGWSTASPGRCGAGPPAGCPGHARGRAWAIGAHPEPELLIVDADATLVTAHSDHKQGAAGTYKHYPAKPPPRLRKAEAGSWQPASSRRSDTSKPPQVGSGGSLHHQDVPGD